MTWNHTLLVITGGLLLGTCLVAAEAKPKGDAALQGSWELVGVEGKGQKLGEEEVKKMPVILTFKGDKYDQVETNKLTEEGTYKTDATKNPKTIDFTIKTGAGKGKLQLGIYKVEKDTLTISLAEPGVKERPGVFATMQGDTFGVLILKRQKPS